MRAWLAVAVVLALAGCAGPPRAADASDASAPGGPAADAPAPDGAAGGSAPDGAAAGTTAERMTAFHWALRDATPGLAVEFTWDFGADNECLLLDANNSGPTRDADDLTLYEGALAGWGYGSSGDGFYSAHAGPFDTRGEEDGIGGHASRGQGPISGVLTRTWLLSNAVPLAGSEYIADGTVAAALSLTCVAPFTLVSARQGSTGVLLTASNAAGGVGASAFAVGSASVEDSATAGIASPQVRFASGSFGAHAARVTVQAPQGEVEWLHAPTYPVAVGAEPYFLEEGVPGTYSVTLDRAGAYLEAFWFAAWGLDGPLDLAGSLSADSVIIDPF